MGFGKMQQGNEDISFKARDITTVGNSAFDCQYYVHSLQSEVDISFGTVVEIKIAILY